jgi:hypothetical protein
MSTAIDYEWNGIFASKRRDTLHDLPALFLEDLKAEGSCQRRLQDEQM